MKNNNPVWTFEILSGLSISDIEKVMFEITGGDFTYGNVPFILTGKSNFKIVRDGFSFNILYDDGHKEYVTIDKENHEITTLGEWWYRGIYSLQMENGKTLIRLNVYNIAEKYRWAATLMILPEKLKHKRNFEKLVADLEAHS